MSRVLKTAPATARRIIKELNLVKNTNWDRDPQRFTSREKNGVGHFVLPCQKLVINYDHPSIGKGGSSTGVVAFIKTQLVPFAQENPSIEIMVQPTPHQHPSVKAEYANGEIKFASLANMSVKEVEKEIVQLRNSSGQKDRQWTKPVISDRPSMTPFDPFGLNHRV